MEERRRLESWKEIAAYVHRSEKTCRRFVKELGMPVHRLEDSPKARVFAYQDELDLWLKENQEKADNHKGKTRSSRPLSVGLLIGLGCAAIILFGYGLVKLLSPHREIVSASGSSPTLAVLYFDNKSEDKNLDFWRYALPELLITDISQSKYVRVVTGEQLLTCLRKLGLAEAQ